MYKLSDFKPPDNSIVFVEIHYNPELNGLYTLTNGYWRSLTNEANLKAYEKDKWSKINNENPIKNLKEQLKKEQSRNFNIIRKRDEDVTLILESIEREGIHESLRRAWEYGYHEGISKPVPISEHRIRNSANMET